MYSPAGNSTPSCPPSSSRFHEYGWRLSYVKLRATARDLTRSSQGKLKLKKRALLQHDIDPARIEGTGRDGRITRADVDRAVEAATRVQTEGPRTTAQPRVAQPSDASIRSHSIPHDRMRLKIAENMLDSVTGAPHVTAMFEADFSAIMRHRARHKDMQERLFVTGSLKTDQDVRVGSRIPGRVVSVSVKEGDQITEDLELSVQGK